VTNGVNLLAHVFVMEVVHLKEIVTYVLESDVIQREFCSGRHE